VTEEDRAIADLLRRTRRVAVVGASARPERPSYGVMAFLRAHGYEVVPVNPGLAGQVVQGMEAVGTLAEAAPLDLVDIFRAPAEVAPVVDEAIRLGARAIWMQIGVVNETAAARARASGLAVVMDRCPKIEIPRLGIPRLTPNDRSPPP
jgi:uncharacterized protein